MINSSCPVVVVVVVVAAVEVVAGAVVVSIVETGVAPVVTVVLGSPIIGSIAVHFKNVNKSTSSWWQSNNK